ncbi:MAG: DUF475 domain-containing protein [Magnetococcus sp. YQC-9]
METFRFSFLFTGICLILAFLWGGPAAVLLVTVLGVLEVSLSFDNAVVNAAVLQEMNPKWQKIFLTIGILVAVFGMRLIFPVVIVAVATGLGWGEVTSMALNDPDRYAHHLQAAHIQIAMFGGVFLLLVFLNFLVDEGKDIHWIHWLEMRLARLGKLEGATILITMLSVMWVVYHLVPDAERFSALASGVAGIMLYIAVGSMDALFEPEVDHGGTATRSGIAGFFYLELLDASFSFDGVIGAFAITKDVVIIMLGLGIGAIFVRSLTIFLVKKGTLQEFIYLEHGAHYAIGVLAILMMASTRYHIPEMVTGLLGILFIGISLWSSVRHKKSLSAD